MAGGRGSAKPSMVIGVAMLCLLVMSTPALGAIYSVGWTFNINNWPRGKSFKAGDVLVFNYARSLHNVVPVNKRGYDTCSGGRARVFRSGRDRMTLRKGHNYFICSVPGHCQGGMKFDVFAR